MWDGMQCTILQSGIRQKAEKKEMLLWFLYQYFSLAVALLYYGYCEFLFWLLRKSEQNMPLRLTPVLNLIAYACVLTQFQPIFSSYFYFTFFLSLCYTHVRIHTHTHTHTHTRILLYVSHSFLKFLSLVWLKYAHQYFSF